MIKALLLIFEPVATWERIFRTQRGLVFVLCFYLLPMVGCTSIAEGYGLVHFGKYSGGEIARLRYYGGREACLFELAQTLLYLVIVFAGAKVVKSMTETFHGRHNYNQAFVTVAYGLGPLLLFRLLDLVPAFPPWLGWSIGIILSVGALYQGLPRMMEPDPPHAFGLYLTSALMLLLATGLVTFMTDWYFRGKLTALEHLLAG